MAGIYQRSATLQERRDSYNLQDEHPLHKTHLLCKRSEGRWYLSVSRGPMIPMSSKNAEVYCRQVLTLFKPWPHAGDLEEKHGRRPIFFLALHDQPGVQTFD